MIQYGMADRHSSSNLLIYRVLCAGCYGIIMAAAIRIIYHMIYDMIYHIMQCASNNIFVSCRYSAYHAEHVISYI